jgi:Tol biopolymer transport system component
LGQGSPGWIGEPAGIPVWSPVDNDSLAWGSEDGLQRVDISQQTTTELWANPISGRPAWTPDGSAIAFIDESREALTVVDASTGEVRFQVAVANNPGGEEPLALATMGGPAWSPQGTQLAFVCWDGSGDEICVVDEQGEQRRQVTRIEAQPPSTGSAQQGERLAPANVGPPAWSPDGTSLAIAVYPERRGAATGVFIIDLERGAAKRVASLLPTSEISWYSDGSALLFSAVEGGRSDATRVELADGAVSKLTTVLPDGAIDPAISPDDRLVAVSSCSGIVILKEGGKLAPLDETGLHARFPAWSASATAIAYTASPDPIAAYP